MVLVLAAVVTAVMAAPVLRAPSERLFGMEIVGRHHDPFTVMEQFEHPLTIGIYSQPVTDLTGALLARLSGPVAAYNWLVLLSFPLSAAAAYLLARHLALSPAAAALAAAFYAFSPFHVAQAAYHPHIAQTQWLPLYLLALWRGLDQPSPRAMALLGAAGIGVTLSNFYGGLIAAVITPVAVGAYWLTGSGQQPRASHGSMRRLAVTAGCLALIAAGGIGYAAYAARGVLSDRATFAFPRSDLFSFSAAWWSYLIPPIAHPIAGASAHRFWTAAGVRAGLLEQQVSLGWGIVALATIAVVRWRRDHDPAVRVAVLVAVAAAAFVSSLSPEQTAGPFTIVRPSSLLYGVVPMFRAYARFGVVVQLMAALLAGIGIDYLLRIGSRRAQIACLFLVALAAGEYAALPSALWRDVLPTTAHRWAMQQADGVRVLDCTPLTQESASVQWLTHGRVSLRSAASDCTEPHFSQTAAASGYTHLLARNDSDAGRWFRAHTLPEGLRGAGTFVDAQLFTITAATPPIYTAAMTGFFPREYDAAISWRWMGGDAAWTIVNTGGQPIVAALGLDMSAFHRPRDMELQLDGRAVQTLVVAPDRRIYQIGPLTVAPGEHALVFHPAEAPDLAGDLIHNQDRRRLSFALGAWSWHVRGERP